MARKNDLFELIHTLTKPEKRYFRIYSRDLPLRNKNNVLTLYDTILKHQLTSHDDLETYSPKAWNKGRLAIEKGRLYRLIMDSLLAYHRNTSSEINLLSTYEEVNVLANKSFYPEAQGLVNHSKDKCLKEKKYDLALFFQKKELTWIYEVNASKSQEDLYEEIDKCLADRGTTLQILEDNLKQARVIMQINNIKALNSSRVDNSAAIFHSVIHDLYQLPPPKEHHESYTQINLKIYMAFFINDLTAMYKWSKSGLQLFKDIDFEQDQRLAYFHCNLLASHIESILYQYYQPQHDQQIWNLIQETQKIAKMNSTGTKIHAMVKMGYTQALTFGLQYTVIHPQSSLDTKKLYQWIQTEFEEIKGQKNIIPFKDPLTLLCFYTAIFDWWNGRLDTSLDWQLIFLQELFPAWQLEEGDEYYHSFLMLNLLTHFELKNYQLLEYKTDQVFRQLKSRKAPYLIEKSVIRFLKKAIRLSHQPTEVEQLNKDLEAELLTISKEAHEQVVLYQIPYLDWLRKIRSSSTYPTSQ